MQINRFARILAAVALGTSACFAASAPALAGSALAGTVRADRTGGDPAGANGTVKIDAVPFDPEIHNEPHVTCDFRVKFFDFDENEHGNIVFTAQPPSGQDKVLLRLDNQLLSNDKASGGNPDPDEIYTFSANDLDLTGLTLHPKQGYHVKLTIERIGAPGAGKHKVFWLQPCQSSTTPPPPPSVTNCSPSTPPSCTPPTATLAAGSDTGCGSGGGGGGGGGGGESGGGLPVTGAAAGTIAVGGLGLIGAGAALMIRRRRRFVA